MKDDAISTNEFRSLVWNYYEASGRHELLWRQTTDPYLIWVSEIMLQQTQVTRVIEKYHQWLEQFPTVEQLAAAELSKVLTLWQGLGYNRRAKHVHESANVIVDEYDGSLPREQAELLELPGIGPYTAGAISAFAYNQPVVFIETNIRTVFLHHFFSKQENVADRDIKPLIEKTLPWNNPRACPSEAISEINWKERRREWYWALMDYGAHLKKTIGNPNQRSKSYTKQSKFAGSNRQLRSELLKYILKHQPVSLETLRIQFQPLVDKHKRMKSIETNLTQLEKEGMIQKSGEQYST